MSKSINRKGVLCWETRKNRLEFPSSIDLFIELHSTSNTFFSLSCRIASLYASHLLLWRLNDPCMRLLLCHAWNATNKIRRNHTLESKNDKKKHNTKYVFQRATFFCFLFNKKNGRIFSSEFDFVSVDFEEGRHKNLFKFRFSCFSCTLEHTFSAIRCPTTCFLLQFLYSLFACCYALDGILSKNIVEKFWISSDENDNELNSTHISKKKTLNLIDFHILFSFFSFYRFVFGHWRWAWHFSGAIISHDIRTMRNVANLPYCVCVTRTSFLFTRLPSGLMRRKSHPNKSDTKRKEKNTSRR